MSLRITDLFTEQGSDKLGGLPSEVYKELDEKSGTIREWAKLQAQLLGTQKNFIPEVQLGATIAGICSRFRGLKPIIQSRLNSNAQGMAGKMEAENFDESIRDAERESSDRDIELASNPDINKTEPEPISISDLAMLYLTPAILVGEGIYEVTAFAIAVGGIFAGPIALVIGIAKYLYIRGITSEMKKASSPNAQRRIAIVSFIPMVIVFAGLGYLRKVYLEKQGIDMPGSIFFFVLISSILYIGAWVGEYMTSNKREELKRRRKEINDYKAIKEKREASLKVKKHIKDLKTDKTKSLSTYIITMDTSDSFFKKLKEDYESTIAEFKSIYLLYRADRDNGNVPDYFNKVVIPEVIDYDDMSQLHHSRNNNHIKNNNYEN